MNRTVAAFALALSVSCSIPITRLCAQESRPGRAETQSRWALMLVGRWTAEASVPVRIEFKEDGDFVVATKTDRHSGRYELLPPAFEDRRLRESEIRLIPMTTSMDLDVRWKVVDLTEDHLVVEVRGTRLLVPEGTVRFERVRDAAAESRLASPSARKKRVACIENLHDLYAHFIDYETLCGQLPEDSGPAFVLALFSYYAPAKEEKAALFFCPSTGHAPPKPWTVLNDRSKLGREFTIDYAGRNQADPNHRVQKRTVEGAEDLAIVCDLVTPDMKQLPHGGEGICVLYLGGTVKFIPKERFGPSGKIVIGEDSPIEALKALTWVPTVAPK